MRIFRRETSHPDGELRYGLRTDRGRVVEFVVQLYCWIESEWHLVAQFDHNPSMSLGHDVRSEGIHMDVFAPSGKYDSDSEMHPGPANPAFALDYAINYFIEHDEQLIERYREWSTE